MTHQPQQPKKKVRIFTWVILVINVLFLIWIITAVAQSSGHATNCGTLDQSTCDSAKNAGTAIGVGIVIFLWAAVDVILGVIWLVTRKRQPTVVYVQQSSQMPQPGGWFQAPNDAPGTLRWWDGSRWTEHVHVGYAPPPTGGVPQH